MILKRTEIKSIELDKSDLKNAVAFYLMGMGYVVDAKNVRFLVSGTDLKCEANEVKKIIPETHPC